MYDMIEKMTSRKAFTLLELLIVLVIIGVLASIALPRYLRSIEKSRDAEAYVHLATIRMGQIEYYADFNTYTNNLDLLDVDDPNDLPKPPLGTRLFNYTLQPVPPMNVFTGVAIRKSGQLSYTITIDQNGRTRRVITGPGAPQAPSQTSN